MTPLTAAEAGELFAAMAALGDRIAFRYLREGCECRSQLMIEAMAALGVVPGRVWVLAVGRKLFVPNPVDPRRPFVWENHTAPTVAVAGSPHGVLVIDPSLAARPLTLPELIAAAGVRVAEVSEVPLTQAGVLDLQRERVLRGERPMDAVAFSLRLGEPPLADVGGSGFLAVPDPPQGVAAFVATERLRLLDEQSRMRPPAARPGRAP